MFQLSQCSKLNGFTRLILTYLITANLPLGIFPSPALLQKYDLQHLYQPLIKHLKVRFHLCLQKRADMSQDGNYRALLGHLDDWQDWHVRKGTYLLLREKLEVLCWRNLIRKAFVSLNPVLDRKTDLREQVMDNGST